MATRYLVDLTDDERAELQALIGKGKGPARRLNRAHILLQADDGRSDPEIARALHVGASTVHRTRERFVTEGLLAALDERPRPGGPPKLDGKQEAFLVALACTEAPDGRGRWTMQLLADRLVALEQVATISDETVRRTLKKTSSSPGNASPGACRR